MVCSVRTVHGQDTAIANQPQRNSKRTSGILHQVLALQSPSVSLHLGVNKECYYRYSDEGFDLFIEFAVVHFLLKLTKPCRVRKESRLGREGSETVSWVMARYSAVFGCQLAKATNFFRDVVGWQHANICTNS
jgi:hypothetical protein